MNSSQALTLSAFYQAQLQRLLAHQQAIEAELAKRNLQDLPLEKLLRLSDLLSRQLQRLLQAAAPVSKQIKPDPASLVEVRFQRAGQGGFQPPVPVEPASTQIKVNQASAPNSAASPSASLVGKGSTPVPIFICRQPFNPNQGRSSLRQNYYPRNSAFRVPGSKFNVRSSRFSCPPKPRVCAQRTQPATCNL